MFYVSVLHLNHFSEIRCSFSQIAIYTMCTDKLVTVKLQQNILQTLQSGGRNARKGTPYLKYDFILKEIKYVYNSKCTNKRFLHKNS